MTFNDVPEKHRHSMTMFGLPLVWILIAVLFSLFAIDPVKEALEKPINPTEWLHVKRVMVEDYPANTPADEVLVIYNRDIKKRNISVWSATVSRLDVENMPADRRGNDVYCSGSGRFDYDPSKLNKPLGPVSLTLDW